MGPLAPTASCRGLAPALATAAASTSRKHSSGATSCSVQRPLSTHHPFLAASAATSEARREAPMPGAPARKRMPPVEGHPDVQALLLAADEAVAGAEDRGCRRCLTGRHFVQPEAVGEALQLVTAAIAELHFCRRTDQLANDLGDEDLAALGLARHARCDVHGGAEEIARLLHHLAGVDPDADLQLALRILLAVFGDRALDSDAALDRVPAGTEADHDAVTEALDPSAGVLADLLLDDRFVGFHDLVGEGEASTREHLGRAFDVGEHDGHRAFALAG